MKNTNYSKNIKLNNMLAEAFKQAMLSDRDSTCGMSWFAVDQENNSRELKKAA